MAACIPSCTSTNGNVISTVGGAWPTFSQAPTAPRFRIIDMLNSGEGAGRSPPGCQRRGITRLLFHGQCELQRLLLPSLHNLLPKLTLMLHALQLRFNMLLRNLQQAQDTVIGLFGDHVENISETLRAAL